MTSSRISFETGYERLGTVGLSALPLALVRDIWFAEKFDGAAAPKDLLADEWRAMCIEITPEGSACGYTNPELSTRLGLPLGTLKAIFAEIQELLSVRYLYQTGAKILTSLYPTNSIDRPAGKSIGRICAINWSVVTEIENGSRVLRQPTNSENGGVSRSVSQPTVVGGLGWIGREGGGEGNITAMPVSQIQRQHKRVPIDDVTHEVLRQAEKSLMRAQAYHRIPEHRRFRERGGRQTEIRLQRHLRAEDPARLPLPPKGMWSSGDRLNNAYDIWIQHQPLTGLRFALGRFLDAYQRYVPELEEWEAANPTVRYREMPAAPEKNIVTDPTVIVEDPVVKEWSDLICQRLSVRGYQPPRQCIDALLTQYSRREVELGLLMSGIGSKAAVVAFFEKGGAGPILAQLRREAVAEKAKLAGGRVSTNPAAA
jgi:hypothetical protein